MVGSFSHLKDQNNQLTSLEKQQVTDQPNKVNNQYQNNQHQYHQQDNQHQNHQDNNNHQSKHQTGFDHVLKNIKNIVQSVKVTA